MTQLCTVRGCRIRNRHLGDCDDDRCGGCLPRVADEGYTCAVCDRRADERLAEIAELAPDARLVAAGLVRHGAGGGASGKPGSRPPLNSGATDALDAIQNRLTTLARDIAETRGLHFAGTYRMDLRVPDPLAEACSWLSGQMRWLRHAVDDQGSPVAPDVFAEIADCAGRMRSLVDGPVVQKFLGPCRSTVAWDEGGNEVALDQPCAGDVYGHPGAESGTCRECKGRWPVAERQDWLDSTVRTEAFTARWIAEAHGLNVKTIRTWAFRGQLKSYWRTEAGIIADWADPAEGQDRERIHYVGDVLDLAALDAARRESNRSRKARNARL